MPKISMIFIHGQDSYRAKEKLNEFIEKQKNAARQGVNLSYFDGQNLVLQDIKNAVANVSMFGEKNIIVLTDIFSNKNFQEEFLKNSRFFLKTDVQILIYNGGEADKRTALYKFLQKNAQCFEFEKLQGVHLKNWLKKELVKHKKEISATALEKLFLFAGDDLWLLENEIKKLAGFCKNRRIEQKDVELLVRPKIDNDIFKTIDALARKNKKEALYLLHNHLRKGESPLYLLSMINFQFRNLLEIKELVEKKMPYAGILKGSSLHPFVIKKTYWLSGEFSFPQLKKIYSKIFKTDLEIKTGKIEPQAALDLLVAAI